LIGDPGRARLWLDARRSLRGVVNILSDHVTSEHPVDDVRQAMEISGLPAQLWDTARSTAGDAA